MGKTIYVSGFPGLIAAEVIKEYFEEHTGKGTIDSVEVKVSKQEQRPYAKIQFANDRCVEMVVALASDCRLYYGGSYLKAGEMDVDIIPRLKAHLHEMEEVTLNFGCQTSRDTFSVLWKGTKVSVKLTGTKKMYFHLSFNSDIYELQLSYENIWQIVLHCPPDQTAKLLVIQLFGSPRIYKKLNYSTYSFYKETSDDQWVRTTDFTPSCIGQSSGLCLQLPFGTRIPNLLDDLVYYEVSESPFYLQRDSPFSYNLDLVPILHPPSGYELPYKILFKVSSLVQTGCLPGPKIDASFYELVNPQRNKITYIEHALEKLYYLKECCYDPVTWLRQQYKKYVLLQEIPKAPSIRLVDGLAYVHRVQVTPTKVYFSGPEVNVSNRVLRHYGDDIENFIRVSFVDEEWDKMHSTDLYPRVATGDENQRTKLYERILSTLKEGVKIGNKKFDFLAFSSSQLRDNSVWMFASTSNCSAGDIRRWMGDFRSIRNVAKYAARLGQSFGSSTETLSVGRHEVEEILDIEVVNNGIRYIFSDGIGKISYDFARRVALKCGVKGSIPSAFQIRYGGYKGIVAIDPSSCVKLSLRPSMLKYQSDNTKLDVLAWSKYQPCFLNRQIITLLSTLGIKDYVFERKQSEVVAQLDDILFDPWRAQAALELMPAGENTKVLKEMLKCGYKPDREPFLSMMLQSFRSSKLLDLRMRARIFVPQGRQMMGCLDETGTLEYGQVFVQFSRAGRGRFNKESHEFDGDRSGAYNYIIKREVVVAKNPCLHPGDVRVLRAIDVPQLHHMVDCVVFPEKGTRPHPNECSGSDLDGDIYFVCWDPDLIPTMQISPMDYNPAPITQLDHDVTIEEVQEYFTNYIANDSLGVIANAHTVFADKEPEMAMSDSCVQLAKLFAIAVDFPKTGVPAEIPPELRVREYPDFMERPNKTTYESERVIGKLYRAVKDKAPHSVTIKSFTREVAESSYDPQMEVDGFEDYIKDAFQYKTEYDFKLGNLMEYYGIETEAEILTGGIMKTGKTFDRRRDTEAIRAAVRSLRNEARSWFKDGSETDDDVNARSWFKVGNETDDDVNARSWLKVGNETDDDVYAKASAWYHVTYHPDYWGRYNEGLSRDHYLSFPWCVCDKLVQIKKNSSRARSSASFRDLLIHIPIT